MNKKRNRGLSLEEIETWNDEQIPLKKDASYKSRFFDESYKPEEKKLKTGLPPSEIETWAGGKRSKKTKKYRKTRKSRKMKKSKKTRKSRK